MKCQALAQSFSSHACQHEKSHLELAYFSQLCMGLTSIRGVYLLLRRFALICFSSSNWRRSALCRKSCRSRYLQKIDWQHYFNHHTHTVTETAKILETYPSLPRLNVWISSWRPSSLLNLSQSSLDFSSVLILDFLPIWLRTADNPPPLPLPLEAPPPWLGPLIVGSDSLASGESTATSFVTLQTDVRWVCKV